jgi:hypothetical protein
VAAQLARKRRSNVVEVPVGKCLSNLLCSTSFSPEQVVAKQSTWPPAACPCYVATSAATSVQGELDELEREEFFRLKKVQDKKQRDMKKRKAEDDKLVKALAASSAASPLQAAAHAPQLNLLSTNDEDELF